MNHTNCQFRDKHTVGVIVFYKHAFLVIKTAPSVVDMVICTFYNGASLRLPFCFTSHMAKTDNCNFSGSKI